MENKKLCPLTWIYILILLFSSIFVYGVDYAEEQGVGFGTNAGYSSLPAGDDCVATYFTANRTYTMGKFEHWFTADEGVWNGSIWSNATPNYNPDTHLFTFETGVSIVSGFINFSSETGYEVTEGEDYYLVACRLSGGVNTQIKGAGGSGRWAESDDGGDTWKSQHVAQNDFRTYSIVETAPVEAVSVYLEDSNLNVITGELFESQEFYIRGNYTFDNIENDSGDCDFVAENITAHFSTSGENTTLSTTDDVLQLIINEGTTNLEFDIIEFNVCKLSNPIVTLDVLVDGVTHKTLSSEIPLCSVGFHEENNITFNYIADSSINLSLVCTNCDGVSRQVRIVKDSENELLHYERKYSSHTEPLSWNATTKRYEYNSHLYEYSFVGTDLAKINVTCNTTTGEYINNVTDQTLTINFESINDIAFTNNINLEATENYTILIDFSGDFVDNSQINVSYSNGTLIKSVDNNEMIYLNKSELNVDDTYIVDVYVEDDELTGVSDQRNFSINDTTNPSILFVNPVSANTSVLTVDTQSILSINISDTNLFAYNITIYDSLGQLRYNFSESDILVTSKAITKVIKPDIIGQWTLNINVSDSHTKEEIGDYVNVINQDKRIDFIFGDENVTIDYIGLYDIRSTETIKEKDRYKFKYDVSYDTDKFKSEIKHKFKVVCKDIVYIENSDYPAHFVCPSSSNWVDFSNPYVKQIEVQRESVDEYSVNIWLPPLETLEFSSIGGLNIVQQTLLFNVEEESTPALSLFAFDFNNQSHVLMFGILLFVWFFGLVAGFMLKNPLFVILSFMLSIFLGISLFTLSMLLSGGIIFMSLAFVIIIFLD